MYDMHSLICKMARSMFTDIDLMKRLNQSKYDLGADIWLMRVDFVFEFPRPTMPNMVYMGGFQCKPAKPLPKVIWKHKGYIPASLGNNTLLVDWIPQNDILGHPKTRLFVAHGGTNGLQEAMYHGVPVVGVPVFFDQYDNLLRLQARGGAKILSLSTVNKNNFLSVVQEVLSDQSYRENMQRLSRLHRDQPIQPLNSAIFWIEFVMRHKGAAHLKSESYRMPWYSYYSIDVIVVLGGCAEKKLEKFKSH
ncbi:UDP-glucuronosyltransferase 2A1-like [Boleophthalmus pectinirostris]|uniref:UDP-glucuronosyltransferase 2A1-like n=1 Tax=Boleophthalmus pectinirostris TaxID=150288 RepID=UPI0024329409|nr:UDP-glucuronosyltransferase 2A1-like [Boleophthalmus pectinirostris]